VWGCSVARQWLYSNMSPSDMSLLDILEQSEKNVKQFVKPLIYGFTDDSQSHSQNQGLVFFLILSDIQGISYTMLI
jgi:hypothetical protein